MIFYTSICANYLPKAMALAESTKRFHPKSSFVVCLVENEMHPVATACQHFDHVVLAKDAGWTNFDQFMFRHSIVEASTAVKAQFGLYLFERFSGNNRVVYLDPDVLVYGHFAELEKCLDRYSIVLAPHLLRPGNIDMELSCLVHGTYNLGFLAMSRSSNQHAFLTWWAERLFSYCYDDKENGIFTDQRWIDLAPCFFEVHLLKHHGYDFATWSLLGSQFTENGDSYTVNGDPLRFIHFSGFDSGMIDRSIKNWIPETDNGIFARLYEDYKQLLERHGNSKMKSLEWSYDRFDNGSKIERSSRIFMRNRANWDKYPNPFALSNEAFSKKQRPLVALTQKLPLSVRKHKLVRAATKRIPRVFL